MYRLLYVTYERPGILLTEQYNTRGASQLVTTTKALLKKLMVMNFV